MFWIFLVFVLQPYCSAWIELLNSALTQTALLLKQSVNCSLVATARGDVHACHGIDAGGGEDVSVTLAHSITATLTYCVMSRHAAHDLEGRGGL